MAAAIPVAPSTTNIITTASTWANECFEEIKKINKYHDPNSNEDIDLFPQLNNPRNPLTEKIISSLDTIEAVKPVKLYVYALKLSEKIEEKKSSWGRDASELPLLLDSIYHLAGKCKILLKAASNLAKSIDADRYIDEYMRNPESFYWMYQKLLKESLKIHVFVFDMMSPILDNFEEIFNKKDDTPIVDINEFMKFRQNSFFGVNIIDYSGDHKKIATVLSDTKENDSLSKIMQVFDKYVTLNKARSTESILFWKEIYRRCHPSHFSE